MRNHFIRLAEIVQEGITDDFVETFRDPEQKFDLDKALSRINELRSLHQARATELWTRDRKITPELSRASALSDLCGFFAACLHGGASEFRDTALEAVQVLGYPGEMEMIRLLARR